MFKENRFVFNSGGEAPSGDRGVGENPRDKLARTRKVRSNYSGDLASVFAAEQYKGGEGIKALKELGLDQASLNELLSDGTNPYVNWMVEFLGTFEKGGIILDKKAAKKAGRFVFTEKGSALQFHVRNLDRVFMWKDKIYPRLSRLVGQRNYPKYESAVWKAILENTPGMSGWLNTICRGTTSSKEQNNWVLQELKEIASGVGVSKLKEREKWRKNMSEASISILKGLTEASVDEKRFNDELKDTATELDSSVETCGKEDAKRREFWEKVEAARQQKYNDLENRLSDIPGYERDSDLADLTEFEYSQVQKSLDDLTEDVFARCSDSDIEGFGRDVLKTLNEAESMARSGATMDQVMAFLGGNDLESKGDLLLGSKGDEDFDSAADMQMLGSIFENKVAVIKAYYGLK